jgi:hypothetical protein
MLVCWIQQMNFGRLLILLFFANVCLPFSFAESWHVVAVPIQKIPK